MIGIAIFGVLLVAISLLMIARPDRAVELGLRYCRLPYMHPLEIALRLGFGAVFVLYADRTAFPRVILVFGWLLIAVAVGLALTPPSVHRRFGIRALERIGRWLRPAGVASLGFGIFLVWVAL